MQREVRLGVNFILGHQCLHYGHHSFEEQKKTILTPHPSTLIRIFLKPQLFLSGFRNFHVGTYPDANRICPSTRIRHVSGVTGVLRTPPGILATEHGRLLEYSIHGKELSSILLRHWIKKMSGLSGYSVHMIPNSLRIQTFPLWRADSKSYGFVCRIHPIRVDEALVDQSKKHFIGVYN